MDITNATLKGREGHWDIRIDDGVFGAVVPAGQHAAHADDSESFDAAGRLVVPPFVDAHIHLDYAGTEGLTRRNESGTLFEATQIRAEQKERGLITFDQVYDNALAAARLAVSKGTGFIRSQVDTTEDDLTSLKALLQLREDVKDWVQIQVVAFPQNTVLSYPNGRELLEQAVAMGVDAVGGVPHLEATREDGVASLEYIFDLAEKYGVAIDVHCDEIDDKQSGFIEVMAALASQRRLDVSVTASHAVAMAYYAEGYMAKLVPNLLAADIHFAICPTENLHLQGRNMVPAPRGVAPIKRLTEAGLNVAFGQDSIADPFYPVGEGNLLRILEAGLHVGHMLTGQHLDQALDFITTHGARNLGIEDHYGIEEGKPAHCIVLDCTTDQEAVQHQAAVLCSVHHGRTVFTRRPESYETRMDGFASS